MQGEEKILNNRWIGQGGKVRGQMSGSCEGRRGNEHFNTVRADLWMVYCASGDSGGVKAFLTCNYKW